ncbi:zinc c6 finger domain protein [Ophiostoma piceae UAMH 11346]|uniref:Zinc c6 finger domain protein n=1 Tax=Ophiostoma piceae (strain UAMH 11346) TaxID=1262450 RepID=S3BS83_OPHP1|nr:zinc c6 finger domain protein [Ophiostoma piceae UAMH 11346]
MQASSTSSTGEQDLGATHAGVDASNVTKDGRPANSAAAAAAAAAAASGTSSTRDTPTPSQQASPDTSNEGDDDDTEQESKLGTIVDDDEAELTDTAEMAIKEEGGSSKSYQFTATINERPQPPLRHSGSVPYMNPKRSNTGPFGTGGSIGTPRRPRQDSETPSLDGKGSSPATSTGTGGSFPLTSHSIASSDAIYTPSGSAPGLTPADWSHLPQDIRFFLGYFCDNITHFHYCMPIDYDSFIHSLLLSLAIRNEPLLYAVVAFSSYHYILRDPTAKLQQFLQYYDQSVRLLLGVLKRKEPHSLGTLLTVLQLATIEEYLGDWINLMGHQKAALEMITDIYMPDSIVQTPIGRAVSHWYSRFDVFVGIMGGFPTGLPRVWLTSLVDYYKGCIANDPNNVVLRIEECSSSLRLISYEMSMLFARAKDDGNGMSDDPAGSGGGLASFPSFAPDETFIREHARILNDLHEWKKVLDAIVDIDIGGEGASPGQHPYLVTDFSHAKPLVESDIVDPYQPGQLYYGPLFGVTIMSCDWESIVVMHELQAAQLAIAAMGAPEGPSSIPEGIAAKMSAELAGLAKRAYKICQMFEQLEMWPASPPGSLIISQSKLAMATLFLPRDQRHHMWIRRKFALIETMGYIFPVTTRTRMAELFNDPACTQWWLPNNEGFSPILQSVRAFADERNATAVSAQNENLREIRHIFGKLQIGEGSKDKDKDNDAASEGGYSIGGSVEGSVKGKSIQGSKGGRDSRQTKGTKGKGV